MCSGAANAPDNVVMPWFVLLFWCYSTSPLFHIYFINIAEPHYLPTLRRCYTMLHECSTQIMIVCKLGSFVWLQVSPESGRIFPAVNTL